MSATNKLGVFLNKKDYPLFVWQFNLSVYFSFFLFVFFLILFLGDISAGDKSKKGVKRRRITEDSGETAKRRSARVRNTKCKKEEKVDFQELLVKFLPSRYCTAITFIMRVSRAKQRMLFEVLFD